MNRKSAARPISQAAKADPLDFLQREQWSKNKALGSSRQFKLYVSAETAPTQN